MIRTWKTIHIDNLYITNERKDACLSLRLTYHREVGASKRLNTFGLSLFEGLPRLRGPHNLLPQFLTNSQIY